MDKNKLSVPLAIILAGVLIAGAIVYTSRVKNLPQNQQVGQNQRTGDLEKMRPINEKEHIRGDKNAPIKIVEYSDTECPFCKRFHATMNQIMAEYGAAGKVAWVYRHFPIEQLHPKAKEEAVALECANELGGSEKFWSFADRVYELTPDGKDSATLSQIATALGLNLPEFNACLTSGRYDEKIEKDLQNAIEIGGSGTPWNVLVTKNGKKTLIAGAQPYETVKKMIDEALK